MRTRWPCGSKQGGTGGIEGRIRCRGNRVGERPACCEGGSSRLHIPLECTPCPQSTPTTPHHHRHLVQRGLAVEDDHVAVNHVPLHLVPRLQEAVLRQQEGAQGRKDQGPRESRRHGATTRRRPALWQPLPLPPLARPARPPLPHPLCAQVAQVHAGAVVADDVARPCLPWRRVRPVLHQLPHAAGPGGDAGRGGWGSSTGRDRGPRPCPSALLPYRRSRPCLCARTARCCGA